MADEKKVLTPEQMHDAERMAKVLSAVPEGKRDTLVLMANSFLSGIEAGLHMKPTK